MTISPVSNLQAATLIVDPTAGHGNYTTITNALAAASSGQTILIKPGTYTENLTLKAGVNLTAFSGDSSNYNDPQSFNVTIIGTLSASYTGTANISNICLQTNSALILSITGSSNTDVVFNECYMNATNNSVFACTSSNNAAQIILNSCTGDLGTTGINFFSMTNGTIYLYDSSLNDSSISPSANTLANSSGANIFDSFVILPITCVNSSQITAINSTLGAITLSGTSDLNALYCDFEGATASSITINVGSSAQLKSCIITSSNTNALTGAGTINFAGLVFLGTSVNNVTTQLDYPFGSNVMVPTGGAYRTSKTATNTALLQAYNTNTLAYVTFATLTANNPPTFDLSSSTTIGGNTIVSGATSGASLVLVSSQTASNSASLIFTSIGGYLNYLLVWRSAWAGTGTAFLQLQISTDNGATYKSASYTAGINYTAYNSVIPTNASPGTCFQLSGPNSANDNNSGYAYLLDFNSGDTACVNGSVTYSDSTLGTTAFGSFGGKSGFTAVNAFQILMSTGNLTIGTFDLYGIKES